MQNTTTAKKAGNIYQVAKNHVSWGKYVWSLLNVLRHGYFQGYDESKACSESMHALTGYVLRQEEPRQSGLASKLRLMQPLLDCGKQPG
jgi:hypothetical protein